MQAVCSTSASAFKGTTLSRRAPVARVTITRPAARVACSAQQSQLEKVKAAAVALPIMLAGQPALALVDERLNGDGTGKILGVGGVEGWAILIVFSLVWSLFYAAQKQLGDGPSNRGKGDDSGLSL
jgi:photosystem II PsbW protein